MAQTQLASGDVPSRASAPSTRRGRALRGLRRALGALLLAGAYLPAHRLLDPSRAGPAGVSTRAVAEGLWGLTAWGTVLVGTAAAALALLAPAPPLRPRLRAIGEWVARQGARRTAVGAGLVALALSLAVALLIFHRVPTLVDAMAQLLQARAWAAGAPAVPLPDPAASRLVQNGAIAARGWVSVYPPGHTALLALGTAIGAPWAVGPVLTAVTAAVAMLAARRLLPGRPRTALLGGGLIAVSPFVLLLGGGYLSHASATAALALALYAALRARDGRAGWAVAAGLATGAAVASRPWTGVVLGGVLTLGPWAARALRSPHAPLPPSRHGVRPGAAGWLGGRVALWVLGGLPVAVAFGLYHQWLFGHPLRLGYAVAFGPSHGLGWHVDPWGNLYGAREALAYSGFDLMALGSQLLETPVSVVGLVGVWLLLAPRLPEGTGPLLAWALAPVAANALYWHHGYHLGPRMLSEAAPAWCFLAALAGVELTRSPLRRSRFFFWLVLLSVPSALFLQIPARVEASGWSADARARAVPPGVPPGAPAVVFVHGSWPSREAAALAAAGMRRDSVETALRRNDLCRVHLYRRALAAGAPASDEALPALDFTPLPGSPPRLRSVALSPGTFVRVDPALPPHPACVRQARADRLGALELEPLLWQTPLPGVEGGTPFLFRDMGPEANERILRRFPDRSAWLALPPGRDGEELVPYGEGMRILWGEGESDG